VQPACASVVVGRDSLLAGPQRLAVPGAARVLTNIQFVLDVSGSMTAPFGDGTRADKAGQALVDFTSYRKGDAFGLTLFGSDVLHWVPVTKDLSALKLSAPFLRPEKMPPYMGGTMIGLALRSVQKVLNQRPEGDRMVVLISDGQSADLGGGMAQEIGEEFARDNIRVFYIHVAEGSPQEETFTLASLTGGQAFAAGDPSALKEVFKRIDEMKPARLEPSAPEPVDFFRPFAVAGLALLGLKTLSLFGLRYSPW
jgi:Ca-activated chloride channel family protein